MVVMQWLHHNCAKLFWQKLVDKAYSKFILKPKKTKSIVIVSDFMKALYTSICENHPQCKYDHTSYMTILEKS